MSLQRRIALVLSVSISICTRLGLLKSAMKQIIIQLGTTWLPYIVHDVSRYSRHSNISMHISVGKNAARSDRVEWRALRRP
ncbi:hypothetical protein F5B17DRAFT_61309 [Nemania serpens]|nr:hypothetical protein F5B17DRAFT_61309 [Nemania serpens]